MAVSVEPCPFGHLDPSGSGAEADENQTLEVNLLLEAICLKYGYDFREYSIGPVRRSILRQLSTSGLGSVSQMQHEVIHDRRFFDALLNKLSINVTEMFRDPPFFRALREVVLPPLGAQPHLKIWHAGCATGEEVYSLAILLKEIGLYDKTRIFATDINDVALRQARMGIYPIGRMKLYTANYHHCGGVESFADYYSACYHSAIMSRSLKENIVFAHHDLVTDGVFGEMNIVICRNVLVYFSRPLQTRVLALFRDSLCDRGMLCLGPAESVCLSDCRDDFTTLIEKQKIYRKTSSLEREARP